MSKDLLSIVQQVIVAVGTVAVVAIAASMRHRLSRLWSKIKKASCRRRLTIGFGRVRITIVIMIGDSS